MENSRYSLSWSEYKKNICNGLSSFQQNGEFVDMTLAADGHYVKVHQVIIALTSPFIKELITAANCPHPVIFLNKVSYGTLCSILEYIYTGEVFVSIDNLDEFIEAGRDLHILGLEDMKPQNKLPDAIHLQKYQDTQCVTMEDLNEEEVCYFEVTPQKNENSDTEMNFENSLNDHKISSVIVEDKYDIDSEDNSNNYDTRMDQEFEHSSEKVKAKNARVIQYTVSNQGSLQMILNRYLYYLKHTNKNSSRQWRCVDYINSLRCPAHVVTKDDIVVQRINAHNHAFHDKRILKKVKTGAIFTAIQEAEKEGTSKRIKTQPTDDTTE